MDFSAGPCSGASNPSPDSLVAPATLRWRTPNSQDPSSHRLQGFSLESLSPTDDSEGLTRDYRTQMVCADPRREVVRGGHGCREIRTDAPIIRFLSCECQRSSVK